MAWYDDIVSWAEPYIDTAAEFINYEDIDGGMDVYSAGEQLVDDASDAFGFIKQGVKAYGTMAGLQTERGKPQQVFKQAKMPQSRRSYTGMGFGKSGTPQFNVSQGSTMAAGTSNPQIQTAMAALLAGSSNPQMNNLLGNFTISPNIRQGRQPSTGSTTLARKAKTRKV